MKKIIILIIAALLTLSGCGVDSNPIKDEQEGLDKEQLNVLQSQILEKYEIVLENSDFPKEVVEFVDINIGSLDVEKANEMLVKLSEYLSSYFYYESLYWPTFEKLRVYYDDKEGIKADEITQIDLKAFYVDLIESGYKLEMMEGMINPILDYTFMAKYNQYVSEDISSYFELCAIESNELSAEDAALVISWDELGSRVLATESYIKKYPDSQAKEQAVLRYKGYMRIYMLGLSNTPAADFESNKIKEEVLESYNKLIKENKGTVTSQVLSSYIQVLSEMSYVLPYNNQEEWDIFHNQLEELINNSVS